KFSRVSIIIIMHEKISPGQAIVRLGELDLFGRELRRLYSELTGGVIRNVNVRNGNIMLQGPLLREEDRGFVVQALVVREEYGAVGVLKTSESSEDMKGGLHGHADRVALVRTGYFESNGNPLADHLIRNGDFGNLGGLVAISRLPSRWNPS